MADSEPTKVLPGKGSTTDLSRLRVGSLVVTTQFESRLRKRGSKTRIYWLCECDCGRSKWIMAQSLQRRAVGSCGCSRLEKSRTYRESLIGKRFGKLVVVANECAQPTRRGGKIRIKCGCGTEKIVIADLIKFGLQSCGCERVFGEGVAARNIVLARYKKEALRRKKDWALADDDGVALLAGNCHYCGVRPQNVQGPGATGRWNGEFRYNGIDRKDSALGYTAENVVPCCGTCNRAKNTTPYEVFLQWADRLAVFRRTLATDESGIALRGVV